MCGIAGYNCSPEVAAEFGADRFGRILSGIWERNIHRGTDAHGYMASRLKIVEPDLHSDAVYTFKSKGSALETIMADDYPDVWKPVNLGIHTRLATTGHESKNENNHPVNAGNVWVTHNGMIDPIHHYFVDKSAHPEVDSYYIAYLLDQIDGDLTDLNTFTEALKQIEAEIVGGYAFHAMFENMPGLSLFVRGSSNPLVTAFNEERGIFLYASEEDAVAYMKEKFNLPNKGTIIGQPAEGTATLMYFGEVVAYGSYTPKERGYYWGHGNNRMPRTDLWRIDKDYNMVLDLSDDVDYTPTTPKSIFDLSEIQKNGVHDLTSDTVPTCIATSRRVNNRVGLWGDYFDQVFVYCPDWIHTSTSISVRYFALKDQIEWIFNEDFELLDIIDWADFVDFHPWVEFEPQRKASVDTGDIEFGEWWKDRVREFLISDTWHQPKRVDAAPLAAATISTSISTVDSNEDDHKRFKLLDYENNRNSLIRHMREPLIVTIGDPECVLHQQRFSVHTRPLECPTLNNASKMVLCSARGVADLAAIYNVDCVVSGGQDDCDHEWVSKAFKKLEVDIHLEDHGFGEWFHYPVTDECSKCEAQYQLKSLTTFKMYENRKVGSST